MNPRQMAMPEMRVVGAEVRTKNALEANPATAKIGALWNRFFQENLAEKIAPGKDPSSLLGVYTDYENDHNGLYTLIVGAEVAGSRGIPAGMVEVAIPAANYLVFPALGELPRAIIGAWGSVWNYFSHGAPAQRTYTTDFEFYRTTPGGETSAEIYIAVR